MSGFHIILIYFRHHLAGHLSSLSLYQHFDSVQSEWELMIMHID